MESRTSLPSWHVRGFPEMAPELRGWPASKTVVGPSFLGPASAPPSLASRACAVEPVPARSTKVLKRTRPF